MEQSPQQEEIILEKKDIKNSLYNQFKSGNKNTDRGFRKTGSICFDPNSHCISPTPRAILEGINLSSTASLSHQYKSNISSPKGKRLYFNMHNIPNFHPKNPSSHNNTTVGRLGQNSSREINLSRNQHAKHSNSDCRKISDLPDLSGSMTRKNQNLINTMLENNDMAPTKQPNRISHKFSKKILKSKSKDKFAR